MSAESKRLFMGSFLVDARELEGLVTDLPQGSMRGLRTTKKGYEEVVLEIASNQADLGEAAGITERDFRRLEELNEIARKFDEYLPAIAKLHELVVESRALVDDERQRLVSAFAQSVESRAKASRNAVLLAKYEKTRAYRSASGFKAAATRRKREELEAKRDGAERDSGA